MNAGTGMAAPAHRVPTQLRKDPTMISKQELLDVLAPRCGYCGHFIANHHGAKGCTSFKAHTDDSDPQPCECGAIRPLKGICSRCGDILHDGDATICELCRGHRGNPWPEREEA